MNTLIKLSALFFLVVIAGCQANKKANESPITDQDTFPPESAQVTATFEEVYEDEGLQYLKVSLDEVLKRGRTAPTPATDSSYSFRMTPTLLSTIDISKFKEGDKLSLMIQYMKRPSTGPSTSNTNWMLQAIN